MKKSKNMKTNKQFVMRFNTTAYNEIINNIGSTPAETGGLLFGKEDDFIVRKFVFDKHAKVSRATYTFNVEYLNSEIKRLWEDEGLSCIGFIHSHPHGYGQPSLPDIQYFSNMFKHMPRKLYLTPIVYTVPDGGFELRPYILRNGSVHTECAYKVELLPDEFEEIAALNVAEPNQEEKMAECENLINNVGLIKELLTQKPKRLQKMENLLCVILLAFGSFLTISFGTLMLYMLIKIIPYL